MVINNFIKGNNMRPIIFCDYNQGYKLEKFIVKNFADLQKNGYEKFIVESIPDGNVHDLISDLKRIIKHIDAIQVSYMQSYNAYTAQKNDIHYRLHAIKLADANGIKIIPVDCLNIYDKISTPYQQNQGIFALVGAGCCYEYKDDYLFKDALFVFSKDDYTKVIKLNTPFDMDSLVEEPLPNALFIENFNSISDMIGDINNNDEIWWQL